MFKVKEEHRKLGPDYLPKKKSSAETPTGSARGSSAESGRPKSRRKNVKMH
ncbi:hypothetical protein [Sporolactobacillus shoreae]|uniref:hypothetical protein n=1 Tax=Sporolactobacillus shoreae TaxID=1465501 RepID=UPI001432DAB2|nr:hypothetical protein [Sporolactobacillus shoreae]